MLYRTVVVLTALSLTTAPTDLVEKAMAAPIGHPARATVPLRCSPGPKPRALSPVFRPAIGFYPIWSAGLRGHPAQLVCSTYCTRDPHGLVRKNLWVVAPHFRGRVTLQGGEVHGHGRLWFGNEDPRAERRDVKVLVIDPRWQTVKFPRSRYHLFPGTIIVPRSGLYYMQARYPGGSWCFTFKAVYQL